MASNRRYSFRKVAGSLRPAEEAAAELMVKIKDRQDVLVEVVRPRSVAQHKLWWALVRKLYENQSRYATEYQMHRALKIWLGHYDEFELRDGRVAVADRSIAFGSLPQSEWEQLFDNAINLITTEVMPRLSDEDLRQEIGEMVGMEMHA
jgi:hypothetical protein